MLLALRRGTVVSVDETGPATRVTVDVDGERRPAVAYVQLTGPIEQGDDVVVNVAALDLGLGSGGFDIVHVNLTRGLESDGRPGANVMKLNYTSVQHAVVPVGGGVRPLREGANPVAVLAMHGQLPCVAWAAAQVAPGAKIGYVQTWGGALPGWLSENVAELRGRGLLAGHITAGPAFGAENEAITVEAGIQAGFTDLHWDAVVVGPGPGIIGSGTALGHGGLAALESAHAALALGCAPVIIVPRMSSGDPRERHRGLSHHTEVVLSLLLRQVVVALPEGVEADIGAHTPIGASADLDGYRGSRLPAEIMGRGIEQDELFFRAALAGGAVLGKELGDAVRAGSE
jgi:hypothetical protein